MHPHDERIACTGIQYTVDINEYKTILKNNNWKHIREYIYCIVRHQPLLDIAGLIIKYHQVKKYGLIIHFWCKHYCCDIYIMSTRFIKAFAKIEKWQKEYIRIKHQYTILYTTIKYRWFFWITMSFFPAIVCQAAHAGFKKESFDFFGIIYYTVHSLENVNSWTVQLSYSRFTRLWFSYCQFFLFLLIN